MEKENSLIVTMFLQWFSAAGGGVRGGGHLATIRLVYRVAGLASYRLFCYICNYFPSPISLAVTDSTRGYCSVFRIFGVLKDELPASCYMIAAKCATASPHKLGLAHRCCGPPTHNQPATH